MSIIPNCYNYEDDNLDRRDKILLGLFIFLILGIAVVAFFPLASAQTITMSNPGGIAERDIAVYFANGTMYGLYNSTSTIVTDGNSSYLFTMVPMGANPMDDLPNWVSDLMDWARTNATAVIIVVILILAGVTAVRRIR